MTADRIDDGVGKKIVEALKMQDNDDNNIFEEPEFEEAPIIEDNEPNIEDDVNEQEPEEKYNDFSNIMFNQNVNKGDQNMGQQEISETMPSQNQNNTNSFVYSSSQDSYSYHQMPQSFVDNAFQQSLERNMPVNNFSQNYEVHTNVEILKQLIAKLPAGVSKQAGAVIIKQTMEALGISMKSVLQDAQQVQESLKTSARECQGTIQEYKKQILTLEKQSQNYQKQYSALNDLISLFIQTTK